MKKMQMKKDKRKNINLSQSLLNGLSKKAQKQK